ncbi:MAG: gliding motility-associated C-terminal domain-containing protein [Bacteroidetes bacterium]|nr:gliding motility-associated C-terminal domain-containing protein [Bacteroidota bacterium]
MNLVAPVAITISSALQQNVLCNGGNTGSITINATGGTAPLQYSINGGTSFQAGNVFSTLTAAAYNIVVKDANNCQVTTTVTITEPPLITITSTPQQNVLCNGGNTGSITINATGGTAPLQYSINGGTSFQAGNVFAALTAATYNVLVKDANNCQVTSTVTITEPPLLTITSTPQQNVLCNGGNTGSITINATGGTAPLQYSINGGTSFQAGNVFAALTAATYNVLVKDANNCQVTTTVTITEPPLLAITSTPQQNVLCNGGNTGSITINATGGTSPLQYSINGGTSFQAGNVFSTLTAAAYNIVVKDANNCQVTSTVTITEPPLLTITSTPQQNVLCNGGNTGSITINATGGTAPLQYSINGGTSFQAGNVFAALTSATYNIVVKDANNCQVTTTVTITEPLVLAITSTPQQNVLCNGGNSGSITINATGGTSPLQYSINGGTSFQAGNLFAALTAATYNIVVKDANNCQVTTTVTITEPLVLAITSTPQQNVLCNGGNTGSITINTTGGTAPLQYSINGGTSFQAGNLFSTLTAATYNVLVKDANNCQVTSTVTITEPPLLTITSTPQQNVLCNGGNTGSITINATGGTAPLQYSINGGTSFQAGNVFAALTAATYNVLVKDANNCQVTTTVTIAEPPLLTITSTPQQNVLCNGGNTGSITINATGGAAPLQYSINGSTSFQAGNVFSTLTAATYNVVVKDANNCQVTTTVTITEQPLLTITSTPQQNVLCNGGNTGSITINATGGTSPLQYSINGGTSFQAGNVFSTLTAAANNIVVKDANNCQVTSTVTITEPTLLTIITTPQQNVLCNGGNTGSITINATGGTAPLQYSINGGTSFQAGNLFATLTAATYNIVVKDANNCQVTTTVTITEPLVLAITSTPQQNVLCNGGNTGSITINAIGGTAPFQYSINGGTNFQAGNVFSTLTAATYNIVVKDANNCQVTTTVTITEPPLLTITSTPQQNVLCNGGNTGSITINATGGTAPLQYSINGGTSFQAGNVFAALTAATYNVLVKDANNCQVTLTVTITEPPLLTITSTPQQNVLCNGGNTGSITINATGGTAPLQYSINGGTNFQAGNVFSTLTAAAYNIVVKDANNCQVISTVTITEPPLLSITSTPQQNVLCNGGNTGNITINATGGTAPLQYSINGGTSFQAGNVFAALTAATYNVLVKDANNCQVTTTVTIAEPPLLTITSTPQQNVLCNGGNTGSITINATGGTSPLQYSINGGTSFQAGNVFSTLTAAAYNIVVKDANNCQVTSTVTITEPPLLTITSSPQQNVLCNGGNTGSITINATGGTAPLQYSINGGTNFQAGNLFATLTAATYNVLVKDANNCQVSSSLTITQPSALSFSTVVQNASCGQSNGSITVNATGGTGALQYSNDGGLTFQASTLFGSLSASNYSIVVKDANNCISSTNVIVGNASAPSITAIPLVNATCNGANNGSLQITASGGTGALQYSSNGGVTFTASNSFTNLAPGSYNVVVKDANGCQALGTAIITEPLAVNFATVILGSTCSNANGIITINANGGTGILQFSNNGGTSFQASNVFNSLAATTYAVVVKDANNCQANGTAVVPNAPSPTLTSTPKTNSTCNGTNDGTITINALGGTAPLQYSINGGATYQAINLFTGLAPALYNITVKDANNCQITTSISITEPTAIALSSTTTLASCGNADGSITITASGGTGVLQYSIDGGVSFQSSNNFSFIAAGSYNLVVKDANNCQLTGTANVGTASAPSIAAIPLVNSTCNGANNGSLQITASGGTGALQYSSNGGVTFTASNSFTNLSPGSYNLVVKDANGCQTLGTAIITEPLAVNFTTVILGSTCSNANGSITINANGGTGILQFSNNGGTSFQASNVFNSLAATTYAVVVKDANNCQANGTAVVSNAPSPTLTSTPKTNSTCNGANNGSITINALGGTAPLQYSINGGATYQAINLFTGLAPALYNITMKDANNCLVTSSISITEPTAITLNSTTTLASCGNADGSITITASGGTGILQYSIDGGASFQSSNNFSFIAAGAYNLVVKDANNCQLTGTTNVGTAAAPSITTIPVVNATCNGANNGSLQITATGGTGALQYSSNGGVTFTASNSFTNLSPGSYNLVVKDANGCQTLGTAIITEPLAVNFTTVILGSTCSNSNGSIAINASGGTGILQFSNNGGTSFQASNVFNSLAATTYAVVLKDANNCQANGTAVVPNAPSPTMTSTPKTNGTCNGANNGSITINALGGTAPLQYSINGGATFQAINLFTGLAPALYNITVKDANNCLVTTSISITEPTAIALSSTTTLASCGNADGSITITASGGTGILQYSIDGGASFQSSNNFSFIAAGSYNLVVKDANNCQLTGTANVGTASAPSITASLATNVSCNGAGNGSISITATGGTGLLQYSITNGSSFQAAGLFSNLLPANYSVLVKDASGCTAATTVLITEPALLTFSASTSKETCGNANGSINISASGGTVPYQYSKDNGLTFQSGNLFNSLTSGNYTIVVKDANNCISNALVNVAVAASPIITSILGTDPLCNGGTNGTISIAVSGSGLPFTYSIDNGLTFQSSNVFNLLSTGTYAVVVSDINGCQTNGAVQLNQPTALTMLCNASSTTCGNSDGGIVINASGGSGALLYSVDGGLTFQSGNVFSNLAQGIYSVVVEDINLCQLSQNVNVPNAAAPIISQVTAVNNTCNGAATGSINIAANGGTGVLQYSIDGGFTFQSSNLFSLLSSGNYAVQVKDANGCTASSSAIISEPTAIVAGATTVAASCGSPDGSATIIANGGTGILQYSISSGLTYQNSAVFTGLSAGNYSILIQDANGCILPLVASVSNTNSPTIVNAVVQNSSCNGAANGSITIAASGGTGLLQYSINNGTSFSAGATFTNLNVGIYSIVVRDASGCIATTNATISEPAALVVNSLSAPSSCGNSNGSITINAVGGTGTLLYSVNNGVSFQAANLFSGLPGSNYLIVVKDVNNCTATNAVSIFDQAAPTLVATAKTDITCSGANNGTITITATGGTGAIQYSIDGGLTYQLANLFSSLAPGNYSIKIKDALSCFATSSIAIVEPVAIFVGTTAYTASCGGANGQITVLAGGGTGSLQYSINNGISYQAASIFTNQPAGNYQIVVKDANNCTASNTAIVQNAAGPSAVAASVTNVSCFGLNNGAALLSAIGGTGTLQYSINNGVTYQAGNNFTNLAPAQYTVLVKDANGCIASSNFILAQPQQLSFATSVIPATCGLNNASLTVINASGGSGNYQYSITNGASFQAGNLFSNLAATNYTVVLKDANNCQIAATAAILNQASPIITSAQSTSPTCHGGNDGTIAIAVTGGTGAIQYSNNNGISFQAGNLFSNLTAGNYAIVVRDANNCLASVALSISDPLALNLNVAVNSASCGLSNGILTLNAGGGTGLLQYSIDNGLTFQLSNQFNNLAAGNYDCVVKDVNNCQLAQTVTISNSPLSPVIATVSTTAAACNGSADGTATIIVNAGVAPHSYSINNGSSYQMSNVFSNLTAGNYSIIVKDLLCADTSTFTISEPLSISFNALSNASTCGNINGSISILNVSGGAGNYRYSKDGGLTFQQSPVFNNLQSGNYVLAVKDTNNCLATQNFLLPNLNGPSIVSIALDSSLCYGGNSGSISIVASGGSGTLGYSINNGANFQSSAVFTNLSSGIYSVIVRDANACPVDSIVFIAEPSPIVFTVTNGSTTCSANNGTLQINASGGSGTLQYSINNGLTYQSTNSFSNLASGNYYVVVKDAHACTHSFVALLSAIPAPSIATVVTSNVTCHGNNDGSASVSVSNGTGVLSFSIDSGASFQTSANFNALTAGNYMVILKDVNACADTAYFVIQEPSAIQFNYLLTATTCGNTNGAIQILNVNGGMGNYAYSMDGGITFQANSLFANLSQGNYAIVVKDSSNCSFAQSVLLNNQSAPIFASIAQSNSTCNGLNNGSIIIQASGGAGAIGYSIDNGTTYQSGGSFINLVPGTYHLKLRDANGCTSDSIVLLSQPTPLVINTTVTQASCNQNNGTVVITASGGTGNYQYSNSNGTLFQTGNTFSNLTASNYTLLVKDANACVAQTTVAITNTVPPSISSVVTQDEKCFGQSIGTAFVSALLGTGSLNYSISNGSIIQSTNSFTSLSAGFYQVIVTDSLACADTAYFTIQQPAPLLVTVTTPQLICIGQTSLLSANASGGTAGYTFNWSPAGPLVAPDTTTIYSVFVSDTNGCISATQVITQAVRPKLSLSKSADVTVCKGSLIHSDAFAGGGDGTYTYTWSPSQDVQADTSQWVYVSVHDGCSTPAVRDSIRIDVYIQPAISFIASDTIGCAPLCVQLKNTTVGNIASCSWIYGDGSSSTSSCIENHCYNQAGNYDVSLQVSDIYGCTSSYTHTNFIEVNGLPKAAFQAEPHTASILEANINFKDSSSNADYYLWDFGDGNTASIHNPYHTYQDTGCYDVQLIVNTLKGCSDTALRTICISDGFVLYIPNAFSPDGDGINDVFKPKGVGVSTEDYSFMIFDRWGLKIFETNNFEEGWKGTVSSLFTTSNAIIDAYVYKIICKDVHHNMHDYTGQVVLIR